MRSVVALFLITSSALSQDFSLLGGDLTSDLLGRHAIQVSAPNVTSEERRTLQLSGFTPFHQIFSKEEGVGPRFTNSSCAGCHVENGKGFLDVRASNITGSSAVIKIGMKNSSGFPRPIRRLGNQIPLSDKKNVKKFKVRLNWEKLIGSYPDGNQYVLRRPKISFELPRYVNLNRVVSSLRMSPAMIGMGLLESISEETLIALSDPLDFNEDGISGRLNLVPDLETGTTRIGRFGFKAVHPTVKQQSAAAFFNDMGLTTSLFKDSNLSPEINDETLFRLVIYLKLAGVPSARLQNTQPIYIGRSLFKSIGCADCHKMQVMTKSTTDPELDSQLILPYTNLLLHDMGKDLADNFNEFGANGSEWRTTPLWGLGYSVSDVKRLFLHDGRARTIEEAILWHGGEAARARDNFKRLSAVERTLVLEFLNSL